MKDSKPFFYRIEAAEFFAIVRGHKTDKELGAFIRQLSSDLVARDGNSDYAKKVISEAIEYINKKKVSGSKGGKQRVSNAQASLKHRLKNASSKTQASTEAVTEKKEPIYSPEFLSFWEKYPVKHGKGAAWQEWQKIKPPIDKVLQTLSWQITSQKWQDGYILDPERYIKKRSWEDEPPKQKAPVQPSWI